MAEIKISTDDVRVDTVGYEPRECEICRELMPDYIAGHNLTECLNNLRKRIEKLEDKGR